MQIQAFMGAVADLLAKKNLAVAFSIWELFLKFSG